MNLKYDDPLQHNRTHDLFVQPECGTIYAISTKKNGATAALIAELIRAAPTPSRPTQRALFSVRGPIISAERNDSLKLP